MQEQTIERARCDGWPGYRNGRKHLLALDRLVSPRGHMTNRRGEVHVMATGPCPLCGAGGHVVYNELGPADRIQWYTLVGVRGTFASEKKCSASCLQSASAECNCSCGGADHGMYA